MPASSIPEPMLREIADTVYTLVEIVHEGFKRTEDRFDALEQKMSAVDGRVNVLGVDVHDIKNRMFGLEWRLGKVEVRVEDVNDTLLDLLEVADERD